MTTALVPARPHQIVVEERHENPVAVYLAGLGPSSRPTMVHSLATALAVLSGVEPPRGVDAKLRAVSAFEWARLTHAHVAFLRAELGERCSARSANRCLAGVRGVMKAAWRAGLMSAEELARAGDVAPLRGDAPPAGRFVPSNEMAALFAACAADRSSAGVRDAAMIGCMWGNRRSEIAAIDVGDVNEDDGAMHIRKAKGGKQRITYLPPGAREAVSAWLDVRGRDVDQSPALFWPVLRGGRLLPRRMVTASMYGRLKLRAKQAGIEAVSPHDMRRSMISSLLDAGADLSSLQGCTGHASADVCLRYDRRPLDARRRCMSLVPLPYVRA